MPLPPSAGYSLEEDSEGEEEEPPPGTEPPGDIPVGTQTLNSFLS